MHAVMYTLQKQVVQQINVPHQIHAAATIVPVCFEKLTTTPQQYT